EEKKLGRPLTDEEHFGFIFEVSHSMNAASKELKKLTKCPLCGKHNTEKTFLGTSIDIRIRGGDWREYKKKNAAALQRDMALHQLQNNDPYGYMRTDSDKADLADKLRAGSKEKPKPTYFV
ncbi:MAG: hypothetical protein M0R50_08820, partial [Candidatus Cloacimonetes bacterium]|nr:hypothetical protein [Candidatus Cloacimonadota bacterium]